MKKLTMADIEILLILVGKSIILNKLNVASKEFSFCSLLLSLSK
jgi:hypothetical protein